MRDESVTLPKNWILTTVGDIYHVIGGGTPSTSVLTYWEGTIPWISSADINSFEIKPRKFITEEAIKNSATNLVPEGSLIVVTRVGLGKVALAPYQLCFSQDSQALIGNNDLINPGYSLYYLSQAVQSFKFKNRGTTIAGVPKSQLKELPFYLPPLAEQTRIVFKIEELFTKIEKGIQELQYSQNQLKLYKQLLVQSVFKNEFETKPLISLLREPLKNGKSAKPLIGAEGVPIIKITAITEKDFSKTNIKNCNLKKSEVTDLWVKYEDIFIERILTHQN